MRIVHAVRSDGFAGVERHIARLASAQHDAGNTVAVIGGDPPAMVTAIGRKAVRHAPAASVAEVVGAMNLWARCDVLHVHMTAAELAANMAVHTWGVPVVSTRHFAGRRGARRASQVAVPLITRRIRAQIAVSHYVAEHIDGCSTVVHPGVPSRADSQPAQTRERVVLVAQRLELEKRTDLAVSAFAASGLVNQGWRLDVAGDGTQREALESLVSDLDIRGGVRFLGHRSDVQALMTHASMLLAPCPSEGLGLTVLEAMASGLPVIAAAAGGHLETVGAVAGAALYPPESAESAGHLLAELARDTTRLDEYSRALQQTQLKQFTVEAQQLATDLVYRSVL